jgi:hypothetical protein
MIVEPNTFDISNQPLEYDEIGSVCLIEECIEDPLEACFVQFGEDLDLDMLLEQADAILESAPLVSNKIEENIDEPNT